MRVGLLIYGALDSLSGGYLYDRKLVAHLQDQGDRVEIISLPWRNYPRHLLDNLSRSLRGALRQLPVDVLVQDELNHPSLAWLNRQLQPPYPVVSLVHHLRCEELRPGWQNACYRQVERRYLDSVDGFVFNSQTTRQAVGRLSPLHDRPWVIASPAGDRLNPQVGGQEIKRRAYLPGPLRPVFLGSLIPRKGLHTLVEAVARLPTQAVTLDVIGDTLVNPAYTRRLQRQVTRLGLASRIRFLGSQEDAALASALPTYQLLVVPSSYEGFGIVYLEGMGFGLPAIGTTQGAAAEIIRPGDSGFLVEPGDAAALAALLGSLHQDRQRLAELGLAARLRYSQHPGWAQSMQVVRHFLLGMAGVPA